MSAGTTAIGSLVSKGRSVMRRLAGIVGLACMTVVMVCVLSGCSGGVLNDQVKGQLVSVEKPEWANNPESP